MTNKKTTILQFERRPAMQYTKRFTTLVLAMLLAVSLFLLPSCRKPEPPAIEVKSLVWPVSVPLPGAEQFVGELPEGNTVRLAEKYKLTEGKNNG